MSITAQRNSLISANMTWKTSIQIPEALWCFIYNQSTTVNHSVHRKRISLHGVRMCNCAAQWRSVKGWIHAIDRTKCRLFKAVAHLHSQHSQCRVYSRPTNAIFSWAVCRLFVFQWKLGFAALTSSVTPTTPRACGTVNMIHASFTRSIATDFMISQTTRSTAYILTLTFECISATHRHLHWVPTELTVLHSRTICL